ncbi:hypothetical protein [Parasediminibacterium sp. JCM 36343]|uniref:hypothetical protein n=1 Tax=Parasediminibacterium sp. JCM 36343 TaxID=3374279 RepID=UPI00397D85D1
MRNEILQQLIDFLYMVEDGHYTQQSTILSGATIGQHVRHSIEMYQCVLGGYKTGQVDYAKRKRDIVIESSLAYAIECLEAVANNLAQKDKAILLFNEGQQFATSFQREVFYCDEHTIHHMALIRIGINEIGGYELSSSFGVAPSTLKYRQSCAQ